MYTIIIDTFGNQLSKGCFLGVNLHGSKRVMPVNRRYLIETLDVCYQV